MFSCLFQTVNDLVVVVSCGQIYPMDRMFTYLTFLPVFLPVYLS